MFPAVSHWQSAGLPSKWAEEWTVDGHCPRQFQLLPLQQLLTQIHMGYNWSRVHFIYGPSPFIIRSFSITDKDFCQKFMRKLLHPKLGPGSELLSEEREKKCLWCKQTAFGCLLESLFAQLVVGLSMERVANLKPRFPLLWPLRPKSPTPPQLSLPCRFMPCFKPSTY